MNQLQFHSPQALRKSLDTLLASLTQRRNQLQTQGHLTRNKIQSLVEKFPSLQKFRERVGKESFPQALKKLLSQDAQQKSKCQERLSRQIRLFTQIQNNIRADQPFLDLDACIEIRSLYGTFDNKQSIQAILSSLIQPIFKISPKVFSFQLQKIRSDSLKIYKIDPQLSKQAAQQWANQLAKVLSQNGILRLKNERLAGSRLGLEQSSLQIKYVMEVDGQSLKQLPQLLLILQQNLQIFKVLSTIICDALFDKARFEVLFESKVEILKKQVNKTLQKFRVQNLEEMVTDQQWCAQCQKIVTRCGLDEGLFLRKTRGKLVDLKLIYSSPIFNSYFNTLLKQCSQQGEMDELLCVLSLMGRFEKDVRRLKQCWMRVLQHGDFGIKERGLGQLYKLQRKIRDVEQK